MNQPDAFASNLQNLQNYGPSLADAFNFTAEDLAANRAGTMTDKQRSQVKATGSKYMTQLVIIIGVIFVVAVVGVLFTPKGDSIRQVANANPIIPLIGIPLFILFYLGVIIISFIRTKRMGGSVKVGNTSGPYKPIARPIAAVGGEIYQRIKIGRQEFMIKQDQSALLTPGVAYRVYFTGSGLGAQILSVEGA